MTEKLVRWISISPCSLCLRNRVKSLPGSLKSLTVDQPKKDIRRWGKQPLGLWLQQNTFVRQQNDSSRNCPCFIWSKLSFLLTKKDPALPGNDPLPTSDSRNELSRYFQNEFQLTDTPPGISARFPTGAFPFSKGVYNYYTHTLSLCVMFTPLKVLP